jgi:hypothetical protein
MIDFGREKITCKRQNVIINLSLWFLIISLMMQSNALASTAVKSKLSLTTANWNVAQTVTVTGVDDSSVDGNIAFTIVTAAATSTDSRYNGLNAANVSVTNNDDDTAGATISGTVYQSDGVTPLTGKDISIAALTAPWGPCMMPSWVGNATVDSATGTYTIPGQTTTSGNGGRHRRAFGIAPVRNRSWLLRGRLSPAKISSWILAQPSRVPCIRATA